MIKTTGNYQDYMAGRISHHHYYLQFASAVKTQVDYFIARKGIEYITKLYVADRNLNNIHLREIDSLWTASGIAGANKQINGESTYSPSMGCCAVKAYIVHCVHEYLRSEQLKIEGSIAPGTWININTHIAKWHLARNKDFGKFYEAIQTCRLNDDKTYTDFVDWVNAQRFKDVWAFYESVGSSILCVRWDLVQNAMSKILTISKQED